MFFTEMGGGGFLVIYKTEKVFKNVFLFWVLCALDIDCIQPIKTLSCNRKKLRSGQYAGKKYENELYHIIFLSII